MQHFHVYANMNDVEVRQEWANSKIILLAARNVAKNFILDDMQHPEHDAGSHDIRDFVEKGFDQMTALQIRDYIESLRPRGSYNQYDDPGPSSNDTPWIRAMRAAYIITWADGYV
jgi:hypothetical protein